MSDFILVGAGAIGMLTALALRQRGYAVTLVDRQQAGRESSWAGGGILSPLYPWRYGPPINELARRAQQLYPDLVASLIDLTGIDPEFLFSGMLMLDDGGAGDPMAWSAQTGVVVERVDADEMAAIQPGLADLPDQGWWMPQVAQIRNPRLVRALRKAMERVGVRLIEGAEVKKIETAAGRAHGVWADGRSLTADAVIIASGAWSAGLLEELPIPPLIRPVRGQMILFNAPGAGIRRMVMRDGRYLIPRKDGRILAGSTVEMVGFDKQVSAEARQELHDFAVDLAPVLLNVPIEHHWAGLRPGAPEGIPYVGPHPEIEGLYLHAGHFRNGLVMGPASTEMLVDLIEGRQTCIDPAPYAVDASRDAEWV